MLINTESYCETALLNVTINVVAINAESYYTAFVIIFDGVLRHKAYTWHGGSSKRKNFLAFLILIDRATEAWPGLRSMHLILNLRH